MDDLDGWVDLARWTAVLADQGGLDPELTRRWALVRTLEYQLWCLDRGYPDYGRLCGTLAAWAGY